ncbi:uncharacterized protein [Aristolochia californica]|uniref:uncharacterized protein n=1 Tax=Aristolochia californica TaxID=171875 RepID=UPI0035D988BC
MTWERDWHMQTSVKCAFTSGIVEMDKTVVAKKDFQNSKALDCRRSSGTGQAEENRFAISTSELKGILQKISQRQHKNSDGNRQKSEVIEDAQKRWSREAKIPHTSVVSLHGNLQQHCLSLFEVRPSTSLSILCRTTEPFNFPSNCSPSKKQFLLDGFKSHKRRTGTTGDLGRFFSQHSSASWPGNIIIHPTGQWIVDAIEGKSKVSNLLGNHIISLVSVISSGRMKSVDAFDGGKCSKLIHSPPCLSLSPPKQILQQRYGSDVPDSTLASCSSTKSTSSCQSSSSSCCVPLKGVLHCMWKSGLPHFEFSVDDRGKVYVANPLQVKSFSRASNDRPSDYLYLFHSRSNCTKAHGSSENNLSETVARMKVSSCVTLDCDNKKHMETEYVLFGSSEYHFGMQSSTNALRKRKGLQKRLVDVFRANNISKNKSSPKLKDVSEESNLDALCKFDEFGKESLYDTDFLPSLELVAIVMKDTAYNKSQVESNEGWGLKFLKNVTAGSSNEGGLQKGSKSDKSINVLIPAGRHGGPRARNGGPTSITERWRSGGHCDCGGWDVGCPLTVLNNNSHNSCNFPLTDTDEDCKSFDLFREGSKEVEPALKIVNVREGLHFVYFQPTLTSLQSFSVAVAFIHSRFPSLCLEACEG